MKKYLVKITLLAAACALVTIGINLYIEYTTTNNFIEAVKPLIEERDTTHSLRNYEVLSDSINNLYKEWLKNDTSK